jgi:hypothetical protein
MKSFNVLSVEEIPRDKISSETKARLTTKPSVQQNGAVEPKITIFIDDKQKFVAILINIGLGDWSVPGVPKKHKDFAKEAKKNQRLVRIKSFYPFSFNVSTDCSSLIADL